MPRATRITKLISARLIEDEMSDVHQLLDMFDLTTEQIMELLVTYADTPGSQACTDPGFCSVENEQAACTWLNANPTIWAPWIVVAQAEAVTTEAERIEKAARKVNVTIGALLALSNDDTDEKAYLDSIQLAIAHVNLDPELLPGVNLQLELADVSRLRALGNVGAGAYGADYLRIVEASHLSEQLARANVVAAVGGGYSSDVLVLARPMHDAGIPLLSQSATKSILSDQKQFPGFARMSTPDSIQTIGLADIIDFFKWSRVFAVNCNDPFCRGYLEDLRANLALLEKPKTIEFAVEVPTEMTDQDFSAAVDRLEEGLQSGCDKENVDDDAVIVVMHHKAGKFFDEGYGGRLEADWVAISAIGSNMCEACLTTASDDSISRGFLASHRVISMRQMTEITAAQEAMLHLGGLHTAPAHYTGPYVLNCFDAVYTFAHAMDAMLHSTGDTSFDDGEALLRELKSVEFNGLSGSVSFDDNLDRVSGYDLLGSSPGDGSMMKIVSRTAAIQLYSVDVSTRLTPRSLFGDRANGRKQTA